MGVCYAIIKDLRRHDERVQQEREEERKQLEDFGRQTEIFRGLGEGLGRMVVRRVW